MGWVAGDTGHGFTLYMQLCCMCNRKDVYYAFKFITLGEIVGKARVAVDATAGGRRKRKKKSRSAAYWKAWNERKTERMPCGRINAEADAAFLRAIASP